MDNKIYLKIADLMSGLMIVFLFIAIIFMLDIQQSKNQLQHQKNAMAEIVVLTEKSRLKLHQELHKEFKPDLKRWNAEILKDNTVRFKAPNVLFLSGKSQLRQKFKNILTQFFPRYIKILQPYRADIEAIRIEGHTSSNWLNAKDVKTRYLKNVQLSQQRALSTLKYCYSLPTKEAQRKWLQQTLRANGLSFAKLILTPEGKEDVKKSRRVEFKVVTKAQEKLLQILERSQIVTIKP